jgi:DNA mismatch repair protein MutS
MKQYNEIKAKYPDALLLFRVGDFYETFSTDAVKTAEILGIVLTKRKNGAAAFVELAGFPHHSLNTYLPKLIRAGQRVAICEQLEDPKKTKKIVKRGVTELVSPGVTFNDNVLEVKENNFLAAIHIEDSNSGISFLDVSTGEFYIAQGENTYIDKLIQNFKPSEVIVEKGKVDFFIKEFGNKFYINTFDSWIFTEEFAYEVLIKHFRTQSLKGFGIEKMREAVIAAGSAIHYLKETHHEHIDHISAISRIEEDNYVWLDKFTVRNLELYGSGNENSIGLIDVLDRTVSPMGARLLRQWLALPLKDKVSIETRLAMVEFFTKNKNIQIELLRLIKTIGDLERLISKVSIGKANPRELNQIKKALYTVEEIQKTLLSSGSKPLMQQAEILNPSLTIREELTNTLMEDPSATIAKGGVIKDGVSAELDEYRLLARSGKDFLIDIKEREIERTGISSLKIGYNNVFGYYLEVTHTHKDKVPEDWHRKQTLTNAERYITEELKEYEQKILGAEEKSLALEQNLFQNLIISVAQYIKPIQLNANIIGKLDVLLSFSLNALDKNYVKPSLTQGFEIDIQEGRHPVIETQLPIGEEYISNNVYLDTEEQQLIIITGPNMSGKSALLRQTALIVLMAQIGSFVPAKSAEIGIVDKIFTRVGASDDLSSGESTFMMEMNETASILNNISNRSLIILDEIGRGTSTYDGISIAWAITEYLHEHPQFRAKVLFATHYHELNEMTDYFRRIKNYHVSVKEINKKVLFLRKLLPGGSEHSFGIHVARMAGIPRPVVERAEELLSIFEQSRNQNSSKESKRQRKEDFQLSFIQLDDPLLLSIKEEIVNTNIDTLTPVEALMKLNQIKKMLIKS